MFSKSSCDNIIYLKNEINDVNPNHIISFIGRTHGNINDKEYTKIDYLEQKVNYIKISATIYFLHG
jgi:hypothetical protein